MSETLRAIRAKYPQYSDLSDGELAKAIAERYPVYAQDDAEFAKEAVAPAAAPPGTPELRATKPEPIYQRAYKAVRETLAPLLGPTERQKLRDSVEWGGQRVYKPLGGDINQKGFFPALSQPTVETPKFQQTAEDGWVSGTGKAVANTGLGFVDFATSPLGFATLAVGGPLAGTAGKGTAAGIHRGVAGAFAADMGLKAPEAIGQAVDVARDPNAFLGQKIEAGVGAAANVALAGYLGRKAWRGAPVNREARGIEAEIGSGDVAEPGMKGGPPLMLPERTGPIITPPPQGTFDRLRATLTEAEERLREAALLKDESTVPTPEEQAAIKAQTLRALRASVVNPLTPAQTDAGLGQAEPADMLQVTPIDRFRAGAERTAAPAPMSARPEKWAAKDQLWTRESERFSKLEDFGPYQIYHAAEPGNGYHQFRVLEQGKVVGDLYAGPWQTTDSNFTEGAIEVRPGYRRKGIATRLYQLAERATGKPMKPAPAGTESARAFWNQPKRPFGNPTAPAPTTSPAANPSDVARTAEAPAPAAGDSGESGTTNPHLKVGEQFGVVPTQRINNRLVEQKLGPEQSVYVEQLVQEEPTGGAAEAWETGTTETPRTPEKKAEVPPAPKLTARQVETLNRKINELRDKQAATGKLAPEESQRLTELERQLGQQDLAVKVEGAQYAAGESPALSGEEIRNLILSSENREDGKIVVGESTLRRKLFLDWSANKVAETGPELASRDIVERLNALKTSGVDTRMFSVIPGLDPATWRAIHNTGLDVAIGAIKAGRAIRDAAEAGWQHIKTELEKLGLKDVDWARLRAEFTQALVEMDPRVGLSQRGTGLLGDENLSQAARAGMNPAYARRANETDLDTARRIVAERGGPEGTAKAWLAGEFRDAPGAVQTMLVTEAQRQLGRLEAATRRSGDTAAADRLVDVQRTLANADMERATDLGQAVQAFATHYANWSPAAWVKDFREKVVKLAADRVDAGRGQSAPGETPKTEATPHGVAQGIADAVADKAEQQGNGKLGKVIREQFGKQEGRNPDGSPRTPKTLEERLAEVGTKNPKATARKVLSFYEKEVRDWRRKHGIPEFDTATEREIIQEANRIEQLPPDSIQRREAAIRLHDRILRMKGFEWWELPMDFWYANILSGFTTHARNVLGNSVNLGAEAAVMMARNPTAIPQIIEALGRALPKSAREAWNVLRTGRDTAGREHASKFDSPGVLERVSNPVASRLLLPWKMVGRTLKAEDLAAFYPLQEMRAAVLARQEAAKSGVPLWKRNQAAGEVLGWTAKARKAAETQARGEGLAAGSQLFKRRVSEILENQRNPVLMRNARDFAFDGTFNNDPYGIIGAVADGIRAASMRQPAIKFVVPFTRIVANVTNSMLNWTPVGYWRAGRGAGLKLLVGKADHTGRMFGREVTDPLAVGDELVRATVGTAALMGIAAAAGATVFDRNPQFSVTGSGPRDPEQKRFLRDAGWMPYAVKLGNRYVSYQNTPAAIGLGIVGAYLDAVRYRNLDEQDALNRAAFALGSSANVVLQSSFLSGLMSLFNQASEGTTHPVKGVPATVARTAASFAVPNALRQVDQVFDPTRYSADDVRGMLLAQVPFARRNGQADLNVFGEPVSAPLSTTFTTAVKGDALTRTLAGRRLFPSVPAESNLTADEHYAVMKVRGPLLRAALTAEIGAISTLPRAEAQSLVSRISEQQTQQAMAMLGLDNLAKSRREVRREARR